MRPAVEPAVHLLHPLLADAPQRFALREALAREPVDVIVGPPLPGMVQQREVELHADLGGDLGVVRELIVSIERHTP